MLIVPFLNFKDIILNGKFQLENSTLLFTILSVFFLFLQKNRLRYKQIEEELKFLSISELCDFLIKKYNWVLVKKSNQSYLFERSFDLNVSIGSWGELITVIIKEDKILFNSICNPNAPTSIASWGMNRRNYKQFKNAISLLRSHHA